jgi:protein involved in polysaccharide export with SLBB domain
MKLARYMLVGLSALLVGGGCSSIKQRASGNRPTQAAAPQAPKPKLAASASGLKLSTNNATPGASAKAPAPAPAKANAAKPAAAPQPAVQAGATSASTADIGRPGDQRGAYRLRPGDSVIIFLRGIMPQDDEIQDIVDESGHINLPYIGVIQASGRTTSQLEQDIQKTYLDRQIYKNVSVSVVLPAQYFFVRGEVKLAGRFPLVPGTTLLQSIAAAGGYNDFADAKGVYIIRGERKITVNARDLERHPEKDIPLDPGDVVVVPRSLF